MKLSLHCFPQDSHSCSLSGVPTWFDFRLAILFASSAPLSLPARAPRRSRSVDAGFVCRWCLALAELHRKGEPNGWCQWNKDLVLPMVITMVAITVVLERENHFSRFLDSVHLPVIYISVIHACAFLIADLAVQCQEPLSSAYVSLIFSCRYLFDYIS